MKKLGLLTMMVALTVFVACNKDDDKVLEIKIDGEALDIISTYHADYGTSCWTGASRTDGFVSCETHAYYVLALTDGEHDGDEWFVDYSYIFLPLIYSSETDELAMGEYEINDFIYWNNEGDLTGKNFGSVYLQYDNMVAFSYDGAMEGTITLSGSLENLTVKVDLEVTLYSNDRREDQSENEVTVMITGSTKADFSEEVEID